jgi:hypothetical protein
VISQFEFFLSQKDNPELISISKKINSYRFPEKLLLEKLDWRE